VLAIEFNRILILLIVEDRYVGSLRALAITTLTTRGSILYTIGIGLGNGRGNLAGDIRT
jgi:hypothetical protein